MEVVKIMKITKRELRRIIKEEITEIAQERVPQKSREDEVINNLANTAMEYAKIEGHEESDQRALAKRVLSMAMDRQPIFDPADAPRLREQRGIQKGDDIVVSLGGSPFHVTVTDVHGDGTYEGETSYGGEMEDLVNFRDEDIVTP